MKPLDSFALDISIKCANQTDAAKKLTEAGYGSHINGTWRELTSKDVSRFENSNGFRRRKATKHRGKVNKDAGNLVDDSTILLSSDLPNDLKERLLRKLVAQ